MCPLSRTTHSNVPKGFQDINALSFVIRALIPLSHKTHPKIPRSLKGASTRVAQTIPSSARKRRPLNEKRIQMNSDDLSYFQPGAANPGQATEPMDYSFLKRQIAKHQAPLQHGPAPAGLQALPNQPARGPRYFKGSPPRQTHLTFDELPFDRAETEPTSTGSEYESEREYPVQAAQTHPRKPRRPVSYISWKYLGDTDGVLGCLTGKVDASEPPEEVHKKLANMPHAMKKYKVDLNEQQPRPRRTRGRDLFALSIREKAREDEKRMTISRLKRAQARIPVEQDNTMLFLETDDKKLIPLTVSRLQRL